MADSSLKSTGFRNVREEYSFRMEKVLPSDSALDAVLDCLQCKNAVCGVACPTRKHARDTLYRLLQSGITRADRVLIGNRAWSLICGEDAATNGFAVDFRRQAEPPPPERPHCAYAGRGPFCSGCCR